MRTCKDCQQILSTTFRTIIFAILINATDFNSALFVAEKDNKIIAGAIMTICNGIMQYHLGGTKDEMLKFSPMKLVIDSARIYAHEMGCNCFHLGGVEVTAEPMALYLNSKRVLLKIFMSLKYGEKLLTCMHTMN
jgi:hypothetical protein